MRGSLQVPSDFKSVKLWTTLIFAVEREAGFKSLHSSCKLPSSVFGPRLERQQLSPTSNTCKHTPQYLQCRHFGAGHMTHALSHRQNADSYVSLWVIWD